MSEKQRTRIRGGPNKTRRRNRRSRRPGARQYLTPEERNKIMKQRRKNHQRKMKQLKRKQKTKRITKNYRNKK